MHLRLLLSCVLPLAMGVAQAAPLAPNAWADPTRPANAPAATEPGAPRAALPARAASAAPAAPQLQSVQLGANGQASALVDGRLLQAGDALGAARVVAIDADGLTLRDAQGRSQRLRLISAAIAKQANTTPTLAALPGNATASARTAPTGREGQPQ